MKSVRSQFLILNDKFNQYPLAYLDNSATTQKPVQVIEKMSDFYNHQNANVNRGSYNLSNKSSDLYQQARVRVAQFLNVDASEIVFTSNATEAINLVALGLQSKINQDDLIALTEMEHHSNIVPWYLLAEKKSANLEWVKINDLGQLKKESIEEVINKRPKILALTHVSNVLGTVNPIKEIIKKAHEVGTLVLIDGTQAAPRIKLDLKDLDADFYVFSGHKLYGPTGIGVLYGKKEILDALDVTQGGGGMINKVRKDKITWADVPYRFEAGTPPVAEAIGLAAAIDWLTEVGIDQVRGHEQELLKITQEQLSSIPGLTIYGNDPNKEAIISFRLEGVHPHDVSEILNRYNIAVRSGHHCSEILIDRLGVDALTRVSFAAYNNQEEAERLVEAIYETKKIFEV